MKSQSRRQFLLSAAGGAGVALLSSSNALAQITLDSAAQSSPEIARVKALTFDVFGTVVDWRASIIREGEILSARKNLDVDWAAFVDQWRRGYGPAMNKVRTGEMPWTKIDDLHRMILLDELVPQYGLEGLSESELEHLNSAWHRLMPWPDSVAGLNRLKTRYIIASLSNGNVSLLTNMAKNAGLPWDAVLSAELSGHYKPDPEAYLKAAELLSLEPEEVMMVAAHPGDLLAAARTGLRTAYVVRPLERGVGYQPNRANDAEFDIVVNSFLELASVLRC